jgi:hypothetical protein
MMGRAGCRGATSLGMGATVLVTFSRTVCMIEWILSTMSAWTSQHDEDASHDIANG